MADNENCYRCGARFESQQLKASDLGNHFCRECWAKINASGEASRKCPVDGIDMIKRRVADVVVIDTCGKCGGLWFDRGELEIVERKSRDMGWQGGFFTSVMLLHV